MTVINAAIGINTKITANTYLAKNILNGASSKTLMFCSLVPNVKYENKRHNGILNNDQMYLYIIIKIRRILLFLIMVNNYSVYLIKTGAVVGSYLSAL